MTNENTRRTQHRTQDTLMHACGVHIKNKKQKTKNKKQKKTFFCIKNVFVKIK
jgi:hypothetical protein